MRRSLAVLLLVACGGAPVAPPVDALPPVVATPSTPVVVAPPPAASASGLVVTTIKKGTVEDTHTVAVDVSTLTVATPWDPSTLSGALTVRVDTWTSPIPLRDDRVRALFFDAAAHPTATFEVSSMEGFGPLAPGASAMGLVRGALVVLGGRVPVDAKVLITRSATGLDVTLQEPVRISAAALGLGEQLTAVSVACGVPLADEVKVAATFTIPQG